MITSFNMLVTTTRQAVTIPDADMTAGTVMWISANWTKGSGTVAFGGPDVTIDTGFIIHGGEILGPAHFGHGETVYVISNSDTGRDLRVFCSGL